MKEAYRIKVSPGDRVELLEYPKNWHLTKYGLYGQGRGDSCWRTSLFLIAIWNDDSYTQDFKDQVAKTLVYMLHKRLRYLGEHPKREFDFSRYTNPKHFTRDQLTMALVALYLTGHFAYIADLKIPIILSSRAMMRPSTYYWVKWIQLSSIKQAGYMWESVSKLECYKNRFHYWLNIDLKIANRLGMPMYGYHLAAWQNFACHSDEIEDKIMLNVPRQNLLISMLCDHHDPIRIIGQIMNHESYAGFCWQDEKMWDGSYETDDLFYIPNGGIQLDKMVAKAVCTLIKQNAINNL